MKYIKTILAISMLGIAILLTSGSVSAVGGGATEHLTNPSPSYGEEDVEVGQKGVQTCIDVVVESGCTVNLTFQYYNYSGGDWGQWETYGYSENVSTSSTICYWNGNVTCATENWWSEWSHWRVVGNFTCGGGDYTEIMYSYFNPENCSLFYIWPPYNQTDLCPCCISLCLGINNPAGRLMNITFYSNLSMGYWDYFYLGLNNLTFANVLNGTYCFTVPYFVLYNHTYLWNASIFDGTNTYETDIFYFRTTNESDCFYDEENARGEILFFDNGDIGIIGFAVGICSLFGVIGIVYKKKKMK